MSEVNYINSIYVREHICKDGRVELSVEIDTEQLSHDLSMIEKENGRAYLKIVRRMFPTKSGISHNVICSDYIPKNERDKK